MARKLLNPACGTCDSCGCNWNGCTKPSSVTISGSTSTLVWPDIDGTYTPLAAYTTLLGGDCRSFQLIYGTLLSSEKIELVVLLSWTGTAYVMQVQINYFDVVNRDRHIYEKTISGATCPTGTHVIPFGTTIVEGSGAGSTPPSSVSITI